MTISLISLERLVSAGWPGGVKQWVLTLEQSINDGIQVDLASCVGHVSGRGI